MAEFTFRISGVHLFFLLCVCWQLQKNKHSFYAYAQSTTLCNKLFSELRHMHTKNSCGFFISIAMWSPTSLTEKNNNNINFYTGNRNINLVASLMI